MITDQVVDKLMNAYLAGLRKGDPLFSVETITKLVRATLVLG